MRLKWTHIIGLTALVAVLAHARLSPAAKAMPARSAAHLRPAPTLPAVDLVHLTTHATYALRPDRRSGSISAQAVRAVTQLLRCHHTGKRHAISRRLIELLYSTARHFHSPKLYVVAGYRAPQIAKQKGNPKSPHKRGVACDFRLEGVAIEAVRDYLKQKYRDVGVGYYPNSGFVHLDIGRSRAASWIDYSAPGARPSYARSLAPALSATDERSE